MMRPTYRSSAAKANRWTARNVKEWTTALTGVVTAGKTAAPHIVDLVHWLAQPAVG